MSEKKDKVVEAVRQDLLERSQRGIAKYGTTLERKDLRVRDWLQHAYEEALDMANYLKRTMMEIDEKQSHDLTLEPCTHCNGTGKIEIAHSIDAICDKCNGHGVILKRIEDNGTT